MRPRTELQTLLETLLGSDQVYFQPPPTVRLSYPCIIYSRVRIKIQFASNNPYIFDKQYQITVIDKDPDSLIPDKIIKLPKCFFDRHYTMDNLNHDVFNIFF